MYPKNTSIFKSIFLSAQHKNLNILSNKSNPSHAWGTYAPMRASVFISKTLASHTNYILIITRLLRFTNLHIILYKKPLSYYMFVYSKSVCLQLLPRIITGHTKPNTRHHNTSHFNEIAMEDVTPQANGLLQTPTNPITRSQKTIITSYPSTEIHHKWSFGMDFPSWKLLLTRPGYHPSPSPHHLRS